jgi:hypothetical protein
VLAYHCDGAALLKDRRPERDHLAHLESFAPDEHGDMRYLLSDAFQFKCPREGLDEQSCRLARV